MCSSFNCDPSNYFNYHTELMQSCSTSDNQWKTVSHACMHLLPWQPNPVMSGQFWLEASGIMWLFVRNWLVDLEVKWSWCKFNALAGTKEHLLVKDWESGRCKDNSTNQTVVLRYSSNRKLQQREREPIHSIIVCHFMMATVRQSAFSPFRIRENRSTYMHSP